MDILRNLFGNVASGAIRLLVAVGILAAAYFFIVRPVLDTTENVSDTFNNRGLVIAVGACHTLLVNAYAAFSDRMLLRFVAL